MGVGEPEARSLKRRTKTAAPISISGMPIMAPITVEVRRAPTVKRAIPSRARPAASSILRRVKKPGFSGGRCGRGSSPRGLKGPPPGLSSSGST